MQAAREVRRLARDDRFDLVHAHYGLCGAVALGQRRLPVVNDISRRRRQRCNRLADLDLVAGCSPIESDLRDGAQRLRRAHHPPVNPAGVDIELFQPVDRARARHKLGLVA
jgi:hypothetical protein